MIVDSILRLIGETPVGYYETQDKWIAVIVILAENGRFYMPWLLGAIPIVWLIIRKRRHKKISTKMIVIAAALAIALGVLGFFLLDWLLELWFGLSYQKMYGGQF